MEPSENYLKVPTLQCLLKQKATWFFYRLYDLSVISTTFSISKFLGSISNDLMWVLFPFIECNTDKGMLSFALKHYFQELKVVMEGFDTRMENFNLPDDEEEFEKLVKRGIVLEFLNVTVLR